MRRDTSLRRATTWLALAGYVIVASGLPLPFGGPSSSPASKVERRLAIKDRSRPFPCMNKPCGCATAEQCFSRCCCNTPAELLVWAKVHRVEPGVIAALARRVASATTAANGGCCGATQTSCCTAEAHVQPDCSLPAGATVQEPESAPVADAAEGPLRLVSLRALQACQGIAAEWFMLASALPPEPASCHTAQADVVGRIECIDVSSTGSNPAPEGPPPRAT